MKANITKSIPVQNPRRHEAGRNIVYVNSPFDLIAEEFATNNKVWNLPFKSKTWSGICREATRTNTKAIKELFPEAVSIKFSAKAGCTCGCSPGYIVKTNSYVLGQNHWVNIEATESEQQAFRENIFSAKWEAKLQEEIAKY